MHKQVNTYVSAVFPLDKTEDELEMTMVCHRPEGLDQLEAQTNFTKQELQILYRGFKNVSLDFASKKQHPCDQARGITQKSCVFAQECPSGVVNEETFKHIYAQFFPHGGRNDSLVQFFTQ